MLKLVIFLYSIFLLSACYQTKEAVIHKELKLSETKKYLGGLPYRNIWNLLLETAAASGEDTIGINLPVDTFVIKKFDFNPEYTIYKKYRNNKISKEEFENYVLEYDVDTTKLSENASNSTVGIYIGIVVEKGFWIICDADGDNNFLNEKKSFIPEADIKNIELLPSFLKEKMEYVFDGTKREANYSFKIRPFIRYDKDLVTGKIKIMEVSCNLITDKIRVAKFRFGFKKYKLYAVQAYSKILYSKNSTMFALANKHASLYNYSNIPLKISTPFSIGKRWYVIDSLFPPGDFIKMKPLGKRYEVHDRKIIMDSPLVYDLQLKTNKSLKNYFSSKKYLIINFWGTWCKPCIEEIPSVKNFYNTIDSSKFSILSIAYDTKDKLSSIDEIIKANSLFWQQGFIDRKESESLVNMLSVYGFPTILIINSDGRIVIKETGEGGIHKAGGMLTRLSFL